MKLLHMIKRMLLTAFIWPFRLLTGKVSYMKELLHWTPMSGAASQGFQIFMENFN